MQPGVDVSGLRGQQLAVHRHRVRRPRPGGERVRALEQPLSRGGRPAAAASLPPVAHAAADATPPVGSSGRVSWRPLNAKVTPPPTGTR